MMAVEIKKARIIDFEVSFLKLGNMQIKKVNAYPIYTIYAAICVKTGLLVKVLIV